MTQDNAMIPEDPYAPDPDLVLSRDTKRRDAVARAISKEIEGREMYWKDYLSVATAAIDAYQRES